MASREGGVYSVQASDSFATNSIAAGWTLQLSDPGSGSDIGDEVWSSFSQALLRPQLTDVAWELSRTANKIALLTKVDVEIINSLSAEALTGPDVSIRKDFA